MHLLQSKPFTDKHSMQRCDRSYTQSKPLLFFYAGNVFNAITLTSRLY